MSSNTLGVDIGGVIIDRVDARSDTSFFGANYLSTPPVTGCFDALARLSVAFEGRVHLISKCGPGTVRRTREWLRHHDFEGRTGIPERQVAFCRQREEKRPLCLERSITHFVDDRLEVLGYLECVRHRYLFNPVSGEVEKHRRHFAGVVVVSTWAEAVAAIETTQPVPRRRSGGAS